MAGVFGRAGARHTYAHVDDNARALVALALDESTHGRAWHLPVGRFDNRVDKTTFIREEPDQWSAEDVAALQAGMKEAFDHLMHGFGELVHQCFGCAIYRSEGPDVSGIHASFKDPRYSTAVGLIRYAQIMDPDLRGGAGGLGGMIKKLVWPFGR